jgi:hypothetical protein
LAYAGEDWAHKNNEEYYSLMDIKSNNFNLQVPILKSVCWVNAYAVCERVKCDKAWSIYLLTGKTSTYSMDG